MHPDSPGEIEHLRLLPFGGDDFLWKTATRENSGIRGLRVAEFGIGNRQGV